MPAPAASAPPRRLAFHRCLPLPVRLCGLLFLAGACAVGYHAEPGRGFGAVLGPLLFFSIPGLLIAAGSAGTVVDVQRRRVRTWCAIPVRELEELSLTSRTQRAFAAIGKGHRALAARSDRRTIEFAFGLAEEEQRWLLDALRARLGLPRRPYR